MRGFDILLYSELPWNLRAAAELLSRLTRLSRMDFEPEEHDGGGLDLEMEEDDIHPYMNADAMMTDVHSRGLSSDKLIDSDFFDNFRDADLDDEDLT